MGDKIVGVTALHEISRTRKAMNKLCTKVMLKSVAAGGVTTETTTEESEMDPKITKSLAGLMARGGTDAMAFVAQLEDDKVKSFVEQDAAAQDAEVKTWSDAEKAKAAATAEAEKAKAAGDPVVTALKDEVETLKSKLKARDDKDADEAIKTKAKAFPNVPNAYDVLKSVAGLSEEAQAPTVAMLKAQNDLAGKLTTTFVDPSTIEGSAAQVLKSKVKAYAAEKGVDENQAMLDVTADPANSELIQQVRDEEDRAA